MNYPLVFDYSAGVPSAGSILAKGIGVKRYLPKEGGSVVATLTAPEYLSLTTTGLQIGLFGEHRSATRPIDGSTLSVCTANGVHDAQWFLNQANALGITPGSIEACHDYTNSDTASVQKALAYQSGWHSILGTASGAYGYLPILSAIESAGSASVFHLTGARPTSFPDWLNIYQYNNANQLIDGITCDINYVLKSYWGQIGGNDVLDATDKAFINDQFTNNIGWWYAPRFNGNLNWAQYITNMGTQLTALTTAVAGLSSNPAMTPAAIQDMLNKAVAAHVQFTISGTLEGDNPVTTPPTS